MIKKIIITIGVLAMCSLSVLGQSGSLAFLRLNADARTGAMGDAFMGESTGMYIYTNPTSFLLNTQNRFYGSYTYGMLPKFQDDRIMFHAVSGGYRIDSKQAVLVGFRYLGGAKIDKVGVTGVSRGTIKPYDYTVDLTYTRDLGNRFSAFLTGTFIQTYIGKTGFTGSASGGVYWRNLTKLGVLPLNYTIGLGFYDLGGVVKYGNKKYDQPTSLGLGGSFGLELSKEHHLNMAWVTRYYVLPSDASDFTEGFGFEYDYKHMLAARVGYHFEDNNRHATFGLGYKLKNFRIDAAYKLSVEDDLDDSIFLGLSMMF